MPKKKMTFGAFLIALDGGKTKVATTTLEWDWNASSSRQRTLTATEQKEQLLDELLDNTVATQTDEFPSCCGIACITDVSGITDAGVQAAANEARQEGYTVAMATDLAKSKNKAVFLRNGWTITKTFRNRRTGHTLNVYSLDLYPLPDYAALLEQYKEVKPTKKPRQKEI